MLRNRTVLYKGESDYGAYQVVDMNYNGRPARMLFGNDASPQSGIALDDKPELLFDYNQRFMEMIMSQQPKKLLIIGGGAFMLPTAVFYRFPHTTIDVVEIDPLLIDLAYRFFDLPEDKRLRVYADDGARFISQVKGRYDMIIIDAFSGFTIPAELLTDFALKQYKRHLKKNGVVALNFISEYTNKRRRLAHQLISSFGEVFPEVALYQSDPEQSRHEEQNFVLTASSKPLQFDYLQSDSMELE